ncbi:penicillin-binding protein [Brachybacterium endophyticum]|uniref:Penicillin-binding protein n=1 Tax=Brachybacterium endophyticum TaxID=2182385 RepID=A0A2U2RJU0_9MICO|nr:serine hydrolase [Brachybacterium endophyticum]PWH06133.1 penicillin-binding protein [Brachybacterium endophyticum]
MPDTPRPAPDESLPGPLILLPLRQRILEKGLGVRAVHLHRAGHEDLEVRLVEDTSENVWSVSKTVTALGIGIAQEEGLLDLEDRLVDHLPAPPGGYGRGMEGVRLRHLITMTSGNPVTVFLDADREHPHLTDHLLGADLVREPGERFEYSNGSVFLLARVIEERVGQSLRDYLLPRLFEPLGIVNPQWFSDREGHTWGATGLHLKTHQVARLGRLLLQGGRWGEEQLVPSAWIDAMHAESSWVSTGEVEPENTQYGYGVWRSTPEGVWRADGAYGQFAIVLPHQQAVVTITSHHEGGPTQEILRAVWSELLPLL